jgi:hypothetical protein
MTLVTELRKKGVNRPEASEEISKLVRRLQGFKRKLDTWHQEADADLNRASMRMHYLRHHELAPSAQWVP